MKALGIAGGIAVGGLAYAHLETKLFTVRRATLPILPRGERPVRVLHISDLHLTPGQRAKQAWIRSLADLRPDVVVNTGDNFGHRQALAPLLDALGPLLEVPGAFVMGSNDYFAPQFKNPARYLLPDARVEQAAPEALPTEALATAFSRAGWKDLNNRRDAVELADGRLIGFVGMDDPHIDRDTMPAPGRAPGEDRAVLRLGVVHAPYVRALDALREDDVDAIIAGHTHGGQLRVPFYGALVTNCDVDRRRASGLHGWPGPRPDRDGGEGSTWLHVSAGAGTSPYWQIRFACRPEATLLTLVASSV
ncbi:metallophosphoesterase [Antribacter gilvus]|uniref:metallophosphoesterase n=1 Tax=Antribacter gilvus TaxID=2304675 RepID=UPI000F78AA07|nr:metallophosphoesterase [Antribacter gilvus]